MSEPTLSSFRPEPKRTFDQFGATEKTVHARADLLATLGFLTDSKILFLGDFDLTSLACLAKAKNSELWVLDVDPDVLAVIKKEGKGAISIVRHNLASPLPKRLTRSFDVVFTDPPYTPQGVSLFLSRAIEAVTRGERARVFLSYGSLDSVRALAVQEEIFKHGILIEELRPRFNEYLSAKTIGDASDLYTLRPTAKTRSLIKGEYRGKIYTYE
ncbi:bis-aminopropyl spermidine synthase family protein [Candidatus Saccharibacteria bacterium]|nr:bis-aminopropyl spermidine synthase family protein [Candidatus Saccharibacteria bacterium]